ncbi:hypothetical protein [Paenibacillus sp. NRS-1781]|uniref:hypothetical protein n=1 Tax=Paenibacillus sp. NRS-1781 TaxID=3233905 RepID=UPI003D297EB6
MWIHSCSLKHGTAEGAEWCWTSDAVAFVPGFPPKTWLHSGNPGAVAMGSIIRPRSGL